MLIDQLFLCCNKDFAVIVFDYLINDDDVNSHVSISSVGFCMLSGEPPAPGPGVL